MPPQHGSPQQKKKNGGKSEQESINLCTPTKTYQVRQVQSSNSIYVLRPTSQARKYTSTTKGNGIRDNDDYLEEEAEEEEEQDDGEPKGRMMAMASAAKCTSTLELYQSPEEGISAIPFLLKFLRLYNWLSSDEGDPRLNWITYGNNSDERTRTKNRIFADIPVSRAQCERDWAMLCAFVYHDNTPGSGLCGWRPSALVRLDAWKRIVESALLRGVDLVKRFIPDDLWDAVLDDDGEPFPRILFDSIVERVCEKERSFSECELFLSLSSFLSHFLTSAGMSIDNAACIPWTGETCLEAMAPIPESAIGRHEFLNSWKDHLPESLRREADLSKLPVSFTHHRSIQLQQQLSC